MELARDRNDPEISSALWREMETRFPQSSVAGRGALLQRQHVHAAAGLSDGGGVLQLPGHAFSGEQERSGGALAGGMAELPAGALRGCGRGCSTSRFGFIPGRRRRCAALYWRGRLYETQDHKPALAAANYRTIVRAYQHFFYAQMARRTVGCAGEHAAGASAATGSLAAGRRCRSWWRAFRRTARTWPRRDCWPMRGLNDYIAQEIAADPGFVFVERAGEAQIYASYGRDVSRHAGAEAGAAVLRRRLRSSRFRWRTGAFCFPSHGGRRSRRSRRRIILILTWWLR